MLETNINFLDEKTSSIVFVCDEEFISEDVDGGGFDRIGLFVKNGGKWKKIKLSVLANLLTGAIKEDEDAEEARNYYEKMTVPALKKLLGNYDHALVTVLVNSPGGSAFFGDHLAKILKFGKEKFGWRTQSVIANQAESAAADVAITADSIIATDSAELMIHHLSDPESGVTFFEEKLLYDSAHAAVRRLEKLVGDNRTYVQSAMRRKISDANDRSVHNNNPEIRLSGYDLRKAGVIKSPEPIMAEQIKHAIEKLTQECPKTMQKRLVSFSKKIQD